MARRLRLLVGGETHHVIQRGNDRMAIFPEDEDRERFLAWLGDAVAAQAGVLHAHVLMTNHVHLPLTCRGSRACRASSGRSAGAMSPMSTAAGAAPAHCGKGATARR